MNPVSIGSRLFEQWLHAHAAAALGSDPAVEGSVQTVDDLLKEMEQQSLPFCRVAVEEYNLPLTAQLRTLHPHRLLLQQGMEARWLSFSKEQQAVQVRERLRASVACAFMICDCVIQALERACG